MANQRSIAPIYRKVHLKQQPSDFAYWQQQPYSKRLEALEEVRREYHHWKYNDEVSVQFIDLENLKKNKQATGRLQDLADLEQLQ